MKKVVGIACALGFAGFLFALKAQEPVQKADFILVEKSKRVMTLYANGKVLKTYKVSLGPHPVGAKQVEGDGKTPEGRYVIDSVNRASSYHLALHVSYPNAADIARAKSLGKPAGGDIMIHGLPNGYGWVGSAQQLHDWTAGCIAVTNREIEEVVKLAPVGTVVEIRP
ncbi:MAG: L,D-transpeptidase family protein [Acidobacteriaceae bacterium]|nr:L,D-transpeptidase family protein [Acidobacteriaceae bacterium]